MEFRLQAAQRAHLNTKPIVGQPNNFAKAIRESAALTALEFRLQAAQWTHLNNRPIVGQPNNFAKAMREGAA